MSNVSPRLSSFSGDNNKGDVSYEQWRLEILGLKSEERYTDSCIINAIRRSARGTAAQSLTSLQFNSVDELLGFLDPLFGEILSDECLMTRLYSSAQTPTETISSWACRIQDIVLKLKGTQILTEPSASNVLRNRFWNGLYREEIKISSRHILDSNSSFANLMLAARKIEEEMGLTSSSFAPPSSLTLPKSMEAASSSANNFQTNLQQQISSLIKEVRGIKSKVEDMESRMNHRARPSYVPNNNANFRFNSQFNPRSPASPFLFPPPPPPERFNREFTTPLQPTGTPICWDCRQPGHRRGDQRCSLNFNRPA